MADESTDQNEYTAQCLQCHRQEYQGLEVLPESPERGEPWIQVL